MMTSSVRLRRVACALPVPLLACLLAPTGAQALERVSEAERRACIAKDAPAADPTGSTDIPGFGRLPNVFTNSIGMRFILIKPGTFTMGRTPDQTQANSHGTVTPHQVTLTKPFYLAETETTGEQYALKPSGPDPKDGALDGPRAVAGTNYFDAIDCILRLSQLEGRRYRLPTEAEFEYASRAGTTTAWHYGNDVSRHDQFEWAGHRGGEKYGDSARPVAWKRPNPWGLYDMLGNCIEYVSDWVGDYPSTAVTDPTGPAEPRPDRPMRVKRSGGYRYGDVACYARMHKGLDGWRNGRIGFRMAMNAVEREPAKDKAAFTAAIAKERVANFIAGTMDNPGNVRRGLAAGKVSGGWEVDWQQAVEYLGKAVEIDPRDATVVKAVDDYLAFLDEVGAAVAGKYKLAEDGIAKARPQVQAIKAKLGAGR